MHLLPLFLQLACRLLADSWQANAQVREAIRYNVSNVSTQGRPGPLENIFVIFYEGFVWENFVRMSETFCMEGPCGKLP